MKTLAAIACVMALLLAPSTGRSATPDLPNLVALPPFDVQIGPADQLASASDSALRFSFATANRGTYPFDVIGIPNGRRSAQARECVQWRSLACTKRQTVGAFVLDLAHGHFHLTDYARYELRRMTSAGIPDQSPSALVAAGNKVSFCMEDTARDRRASSVYGVPLYQLCDGVQQGISSGWEDVYDYSLAGQQIELSGVPDGDYAIVVTVDPDHHFVQTSNEDDQAFTPIQLAGDGTTVTVLAHA